MAESKSELILLARFVLSKIVIQRGKIPDWRRVTLYELESPDAVESALREGQAAQFWSWTRIGNNLSCVVSDEFLLLLAFVDVPND